MTARMCIVLENISSVREAVFSRIEQNYFSGGQANVVPDHRSRMKTNISR